MRMIAATLYWLSRYAVTGMVVRSLRAGDFGLEHVLITIAGTFGCNLTIYGLLKESRITIPKGVHLISLSRWEHYVYFNVA